VFILTLTCILFLGGCVSGMPPEDASVPHCDQKTFNDPEVPMDIEVLDCQFEPGTYLMSEFIINDTCSSPNSTYPGKIYLITYGSLGHCWKNKTTLDESAQIRSVQGKFRRCKILSLVNYVIMQQSIAGDRIENISCPQLKRPSITCYIKTIFWAEKT